MALSLGLDLGSTRIKVGVGTDGGMTVLSSAPAPSLTGTGPICEGDPLAYLEAATGLLMAAIKTVPDVPVGIACQRSSFLIWQKSDGRPLTPFISWQDRRADGWCRCVADQADCLADATGLILSPHYVGPKLATLFQADPALMRAMGSGEALFGTLETYLLWRWSDGRIHHTDLSMAARTMMVRRGTGGWDAALLACFGVPRRALPGIGPSAGLNLSIFGGATVRATVADQAAASLALGDFADTALVNLGTGGFVMRRTDQTEVAKGFLAGPLFGKAGRGGAGIISGPTALEGTINGIGPALDKMAPGPVPLLDLDPTPEAFCLPDAAGIGAPHWRPELPQIWSDRAKGLGDSEQRRVMLEGIVFRAWEIASGMAPERPPSRLVLAGGMANEPFIPPALAACAGVPVARLLEPEATLMGAAGLAAGRLENLAPGGAKTRTLETTGGNYLAQKYQRWQSWLAGVLG